MVHRQAPQSFRTERWGPGGERQLLPHLGPGELRWEAPKRPQRAPEGQQARSFGGEGDRESDLGDRKDSQCHR